MKNTVSRWRMWRWPIALAIGSATGLVVALLGDGGWDVAASLALALPIAVSIWSGLRRGRDR